jgi:hypothetical protein
VLDYSRYVRLSGKVKNWPWCPYRQGLGWMARRVAAAGHSWMLSFSLATSYKPIQSPLISTTSEGDREIQIIDHAKPIKRSPA